METKNISEKEFKDFLKEEYFFTDLVSEAGEEPIILNDGMYYGSKEDNIFRFEIKDGEVISLTDIEPEEIRLEDIENTNSGIDSLFQSWLTDFAVEDYSRKWIVSFCKNTNFQSLSEGQLETIGEMFDYANVPWMRCFDWASSLGDEKNEQSVGRNFVMTAIKSGIFPWGD